MEWLQKLLTCEPKKYPVTEYRIVKRPSGTIYVEGHVPPWDWFPLDKDGDRYGWTRTYESIEASQESIERMKAGTKYYSA